MHEKPFKTIPEQIIHLKNKGIRITSYKSIFSLLSSKMYCSSITPYKNTFGITKSIDDNHIYNDFTDADFIMINDLDWEITNIFRNACIKIESKLRVNFVEYICSRSDIENYDYEFIINTITQSDKVKEWLKDRINNDTIKFKFKLKHLECKDVKHSQSKYSFIPI